jgi:hypothetical protein
MTSVVKYGFTARNVEGGAIKFTAETLQEVTAIPLCCLSRLRSFSNLADFLSRQSYLTLYVKWLIGD